MLNCTADRSSSSTVLGSHYGGEEHEEDGKRNFFHKVTQKSKVTQRLKHAFIDKSLSMVIRNEPKLIYKESTN